MNASQLARAARILVGLGCIAGGCALGEATVPVDGRRSPAPTEGAPPPQTDAPATAWAPEVALLEIETLAALEQRGFTLGQLVAGSGARTGEELARLPAFESIFELLRSDVRQAARGYPEAMVTTIGGFRLFDSSLLASPDTSFELVGAFNRMDRAAFQAGTCGEVRFVYRLRYATTQAQQPMTGRLPMTVNVVFLVDGKGGCQAAARAWQSGAGSRMEGLTAPIGPLGPEQRKRWTLKSVETNLQTIRLQSSVQPTLAGHVEYSLRVFHPGAAGGPALAPAALENTPDVAALQLDDALRAELLAYLKQREVLAAIDQGTLRIPDRFLASSARSVAPRGTSRIANRAFSSLFSRADFEGLELGEHRTITSPAALLRRLDGATCAGCHQSRSIAGFHLAGEERADNPRYASLLSGVSSHLHADLERRRAYVAAIAGGELPDEHRPSPERQGVGDGHGAPCSLGDPGFADWTCAEGLRCKRIEDEEIGVCLSEQPAIGAPCAYGALQSRADPRKDFVSAMTPASCGPVMQCDRNPSGFALGACAAACSPELPDSACADFLDVDGFQNCLRFGLSHERCAREYVFDAGMRACDASRPCRQDYVCVRTETDGVGACVPPYFVYPLRLDGHPMKAAPRTTR